MILAAWEPDPAAGLAWVERLGAQRVAGEGQPAVVVAIDEPGTAVFDDGSIRVVAEGVSAELVARAYRREGIRCVTRLPGDFALAVYDRDRRELLATSALTSHRTLAYWHGGRTTLVASSPLALLKHPATPRALDEAHVAHVVYGLGAMERGSTPIAGVRRLGAGEGLRVTEGETRVAQVDRLVPRSAEGRREQRIAAFWETLESVVAREMAAGGKVCLSLSGGLDSTAIAAAMSPQRDDLDAFSMVSSGLGAHPEASALDALEGTWPRLRLHRIDCADAADYPDLDAVPLWDDPQLTPLSLLPARMRLWEAARRAGFTAVLDGEGGDEIFNALESPLDALLGGRWLSLGAYLRGRPDRRAIVRRSLLLPLFGARATRALRARPPRADDVLPAFASWAAQHQAPVRLAVEQRLATASRGSRCAILERWLSSPVRVGPAQTYDRLARTVGLRRSSPLVHREVVELLLGLPAADGLSAYDERPFLRAALARRVPQGAWTAQKDEQLATAMESRIVSASRARARLADPAVRRRLADWVRFDKVDAMLDAAAAGRPLSLAPVLALEGLISFADWYARASREYGVD